GAWGAIPRHAPLNTVVGGASHPGRRQVTTAEKAVPSPSGPPSILAVLRFAALSTAADAACACKATRSNHAGTRSPARRVIVRARSGKVRAYGDRIGRRPCAAVSDFVWPHICVGVPGFLPRRCLSLHGPSSDFLR